MFKCKLTSFKSSMREHNLQIIGKNLATVLVVLAFEIPN